MMGSRKKVRTVRDNLLAEGIPTEHLDRIHAPIGLEIGAEIPAEIAIAILARIIAVRSGTTGSIHRSEGTKITSRD